MNLDKPQERHVTKRNSTDRGREFEREVEKLLRLAGFEVVANAKTARPRQTDLFARADGTDFIVEAKNRKSRIHVGDIDALRSRLRRVASDIVGIIFTTSELTRGAIREIEANRQREILVFVRDEIAQVQRGEKTIKSLLERKRKELRISGKVWFGPLLGSEYTTVRLPIETLRFVVEGKSSSHVESGSEFFGACFVLQIPDPGWGMSGGEGARLKIDLAVNSGKDLRNIFGYVHDHFGLSKNGMFSIHQTECCWFGLGPETFLRTVDGWEERYRRSKSRRFHHAESLVYFDQFRDGWIEISAQHHFNPGDDGKCQSSFLHSDLVVQLPGIPVDTAPFLKLCQYAGAEWASFEFIGERWTHARRLKKPLRLRTTGLIEDREYDRSTGERTVVGVVAQNPFYKKKTLPDEFEIFDKGIRQELTETELIPCALRHWHSADMAVDYYRLTGIEATIGGAGNIIRPFGNWNKRLTQ